MTCIHRWRLRHPHAILFSLGLLFFSHFSLSFQAGLSKDNPEFWSFWWYLCVLGDHKRGGKGQLFLRGSAGHGSDPPFPVADRALAHAAPSRAWRVLSPSVCESLSDCVCLAVSRLGLFKGDLY